MKRQKYTKADFAWVKWGAKDFERIAEDIIQRKKVAYAAIRAIPAYERTFENTVYALEASGEREADELHRIGLLKEVSPDSKVRVAAAKTIEKLHKQMVEIEFDPRMYASMKEYAKKKEKLGGPEKRLFTDLMKGYARMGLGLPKMQRNELKSNLKLLSKLGLEFDRNLNEHKDFILVNDEELDGLPDTYIANLEKVGDKYKVTLAYPDIFPYMAGAHSEERRRELSEKFSRRGGKKNVALLKRMFSIRARNARMLGYKNHADFQTELRMAKSARRVLKFVRDLEARTKKQVKSDFEMLVKEKRRRSGNSNATLKSHDISYLFKQIKLKRYGVDSDKVKEYFPFEHVKQATLDAYQNMLGVRFSRRSDIAFWHGDVQMYDVHDKSGEYLSSFLLDLYPRDGKYGHAAAFEITYGRQEGESYRAPLAAMVANFPKSSSANPSLMSHGEVETFFHEFGHIMHFTLTKAIYSAQAGFSVAWDFVEAPSQMLENWTWDAQMLKRLSRHYKTNLPMPNGLIKKIIKSRLLGEAWSVRGQVVLAMLDMIIHTKGTKDPVALYAELSKKMMRVSPPKKQIWIAGFGHIVHGYDAGYYGYLWSRVYAEDMFTRFKRGGVLNSRTGSDYRKWILEKGSSMDELDLVKKFLGRKPNNKAFIKSIGA